MELKRFLKTLKLNESSISVVLGIIVVIAVSILVVNYFRKGGKEGTVPSITETVTEETKAVPGQKYTVSSGESLWSIAEKAYGSGYNWVDIAKENKINNSDFIEAGQKLILPKVEAKTATSTNHITNLETQAVNETISGATYTVVKGDNLWTIAVRAYGDGYKWTEIAKENKLKNPDIIHSGNILTLPR